MEVVRSAVRIKDRMLYGAKKFGDVLFIDVKCFLGKLIEGLLVGSLLIEPLSSRILNRKNV